MKTNRNWMKRAAMLLAMAGCALAAQDAFAAKADVSAGGTGAHLEDAASLTPTPMPRAKAMPKTSADTYEATGDLGITMRHGDTMRLYFDINKAYTRITSARLVLHMWDVDYPSATEQDNVYFNGTYLGRLEGLNNGWDYNYFDVPISKITVPSSGESSSRNAVTIEVSVNPSGWVTRCGSAQLIINGDTFSLTASRNLTGGISVNWDNVYGSYDLWRIGPDDSDFTRIRQGITTNGCFDTDVQIGKPYTYYAMQSGAKSGGAKDATRNGESSHGVGLAGATDRPVITDVEFASPMVLRTDDTSAYKNYNKFDVWVTFDRVGTYDISKFKIKVVGTMCRPGNKTVEWSGFTVSDPIRLSKTQWRCRFAAYAKNFSPELVLEDRGCYNFVFAVNPDGGNEFDMTSGKTIEGLIYFYREDEVDVGAEKWPAWATFWKKDGVFANVKGNDYKFKNMDSYGSSLREEIFVSKKAINKQNYRLTVYPYDDPLKKWPEEIQGSKKETDRVNKDAVEDVAVTLAHENRHRDIYRTYEGVYAKDYMYDKVSSATNHRDSDRGEGRDSLTDGFEEYLNKTFKYRLAASKVDTYNLGTTYNKKYKAYGDNEFLARKAGLEQMNKEHCGVIVNLDFAYPGLQMGQWQTISTSKNALVKDAENDAEEEVEDENIGGVIAEWPVFDEAMSNMPVLFTSNDNGVLIDSSAEDGASALRFNVRVTCNTNEWHGITNHAFEVRGYLADKNGSPVAWTVSDITFTNRSVDVALDFAGEYIHAHRGSGYSLKYVSLALAGIDIDMVAAVGVDVASTGEDISADAFSGKHFFLTDFHENVAAKNLKVLFNAEVKESGVYTFKGHLAKSGTSKTVADTVTVVTNLTSGATTFPVELSFPGQQIYLSGVDGAYSLSFLTVSRDDTAITAKCDVYELTNEYNHLDFKVLDSSLSLVNGSASFGTPATASDGFLGALPFSVAINNSGSSGKFHVTAVLEEAYSNKQYVASYVGQKEFTNGLNLVSLSFSSGDIKVSRIDGPYSVRNIRVQSVSDPSVVEVFRPDVVTGEYKADDFGKSPVELVGTPLVNTSGSAPVVTLSVEGLRDCVYNASAVLLDSNREFVAYVVTTNTITAGVTNIVTLTFDEAVIIASGHRGPYILDYVMLEPQNGADAAKLYSGAAVSDIDYTVADAYVDAVNGSDSNGGTSWSDAYQTIQAAVNVSMSGDTILVADGTYASFQTGNKEITIQSRNGPRYTIIDGGGTNRCATLGTSAGQTNTVLRGFTLRNGNANGSAVTYFRTCGGGVCCGSVEDCVLANNEARYGGGACNASLQKCSVVGNRAGNATQDGSGGAIYWTAAGLSASACYIADNTAYRGSAIYAIGNGYCTLANSLVANNTSLLAFALYAQEQNSLKVVKCTVVDNNCAPGCRRGAYNVSCVDSIIHCNYQRNNPFNFSDNAAYGIYTNCCTTLEGSTSPASEIITDIPAFVDRKVRIYDLLSTSGENIVGAGKVVDTNCMFKVGVEIDGYGVVTRPGAIVSPGDAIELTAEETGRAFEGFYTNGVFVTLERTLVLNDIRSDIRVTAKFAKHTAYVAANGNDANDGLTAGTPKKSINAALPIVENGEAIEVAPGTYAPIVPTGYPSKGKSIRIYSTHGASRTVIDGGGVSRCADLSDYNGGTTNMALEGFTLTNGSTANVGGGAYYGTLVDCVIIDNVAGTYGGGSGYSRLINCVVARNSAESYGGGMYYGVADHCTICGNEAGAIGGGAYYGTINNCIVSKNVVGGNEANWTSCWIDSCCTYPNPGSNPIVGDPMLVDGWNGDARLRIGSPCIVNGVQVCGAYVGEPIEGISISVGVQGTGTVSKETILVTSGGNAVIEAVETVRPFLYWNINGERIEDRIYTLTNVTTDVRAIAVFGTFDWYVDAEYGDDENDGSDWDAAKRTLQSAVAAAVDDETIYVEAGTYGPISTDNKRIRIESMNGAEMTFIDGGGASRCATLGSTSTHTNSALVGFTLLNGRAPLSGNYAYGGGSYYGTLECCVISNCVASGYYAYGGGAYYGYLNNCLVAYNCATSSSYRAYGGGAYSSVLRSCAVARNCAAGANAAYAGGTYGNGYSAYNTIIWGNEAWAPNASNAYYPDSYYQYLYSCCTSSSSDRRYSGTITNDPQFVDVDAGNFHLKVGSPCLNTGYDWYVQGDMDLDWDDRMQGAKVDMGCYEGAEYAAPPGQVTGLRAVRGVLTWGAMPDAEGFMVYRSTRRAASSAKYIGMSDTNTYTDETAAEGTTYYYWVTAFNTLGTGTRSELAENLWIDPLAIVTASLPDGRVHDGYSVQLQATGGLSPLRWEAVVPGYVVSSNDSTFATTGTAKGWYADDNYWTLALPFDFPFYGRTYRTAYVSSNGTISFGQGISSTSYFSSTFLNNAMIAVLWKDLSTDGSGDIFVTPGETSVTIRWSAVYLSGGNAVNFSATLHADGRIVLAYGDGNTKGGMCGISAGDGERGIIARNNSTSWSNAKDIVFADGGYVASPESLPDGLMLSEDGALSGVATRVGTYAFYVRVTDGMGDSQVAEFQLEIEKNPIALHVDAMNGDDANGGLSIESAKRSLQRAIDFALDDDTILVAPGVYEPISTGNKRIRIESVNGARTTFIDGGGTNRCATLGTTTNSVLAGFTLLNGRAPQSGSNAHGGGSYYGTLERCIISNCVANGYYAYGGGAYYGNLNNCLVAYNCATSSSYRAYGGGTYGSTLYSCTISRNSARGSNAAYAGGTHGNSYAYNTIIWGNDVWASNVSSAYYPNAYHQYMYCCCTDSSASYRYSGTITNDPQFVDADAGDFRLSLGSPCLEAGDNSYAFEDKDLNGNSRIVDTAVDMGCYEGSVYNVQPGLVTGEPLAITTATLPDAMEMVEYAAQLEASGGTEPYFWEAVSKGYAYSRADNTFATGGEAQEWGSYWTTKRYVLPFGFTFYGKTYDEVYVNENGTLSFGESFTASSPTWWEDYLEGVPFIAPEWDWTTSSSNKVYVSATTDAITFSWDVGSVYGDCRCAFSATLQRDGTIRFSYGEGKSSYSFAGLSAGDGVRYAVVATRQGGGIGNWVRDVVLTPCYVASAAEMPDGLVLDSSGLLHGMMTMAWTNSIAVRVRDAAGAIVVRELPFSVAASPNRRPVIENATPTNAVTFVKVGDSRTFSVIAGDPEGTPLSYRWEIDGESVAGADAEHYTYSPSAEDAGEVRVLTCFVSDDLWTENVLTNWTVKVPRTIYVDAASTNDEWNVDGSSPELAYRSLERAVNYAELGDTILVAPGVYEGYLDFRPDGIGYGEPEAFITVKSIAGPGSTTLKGYVVNSYGGWEREDFARYYTGNFYEDEQTRHLPVLDGFTLKCQDGIRGVSLANCIVSGDEDGERIYGLSGCRLSDCIVTGCRSSDQLLYSCELTRCTVAGNRVPNECFAVGAGSLLIDSIVYENADDTGATANYNPETYQGHAWEETEDGYREWTVDVPCVVFTNSCTYPLPTMVGSHGNISDNPRLVDAVGGDLRLRVGSPCIVDGVQTMGAYLGSPVAGHVIVLRIEGHGAVSPMQAVVENGGDATFEVADGARPFLGFLTNGVFATAANTFVWQGVMVDGAVTAVFSNFTFHVDAATGSDANDGLSWATAKASIQAAVGEALDGEVVYVKPGTYTPINSNGKRICIESVDGKSVTIIDGGGTNRCATLGSTTNTLVRGFRLTNGMASEGGAAYYGSLEDCDVVGNVATRYGGGLYYSVAIRCRIMGNIVQGSSWYARGGGACYGMLRNCLVAGNAADCSDSGNGGGTYYGTHYNCTIVNNSVSGTSCQGGGAYGGTHYNTIVYGNLATNVPNEVNFVNAYNSLVGIDPLFADSDYRPAAGSLCIDSGNNSYVIDDIDLDGNARLQHYTVDIGCYEYALATPERDAGADFAAQMAGTCYGVFVGVGRYTYTSSLTGPTSDATNMQTRCITNGYWHDTNTVALLDTAATKNAVRAHLFSLAAKAVSGDTVLYYQSSHGGSHASGGNYTKDTCICLHDETYEDYEMAEDLMQFAAGVKVVIVLDTCHSAGMFKAMGESSPASAKSFALRVRELMAERAALRKGVKSGITTDDIGWIAAADYNQYSYDSPRGGAFTVALLDGWKTGAADYDGDKRLNFHELWRYAKGIAVGYGGSDASDAQCLNENVLLSRFAGAPDSSGNGDTTETTPAPVEHVWLDAYPGVLAAFGGDYEAMASAPSPGASGGGKTWPDGSPYYVWQDFVAGTSPTNDTVFTATIRMEGNTLVVTWEPDTPKLRATRVYRTLGKKTLLDANWTDITDKDQSEYHFFRVTVDMP